MGSAELLLQVDLVLVQRAHRELGLELGHVRLRERELVVGEPRALLELADAVMDALGGREAWDATRFVRWNFFGSRVHHWDRYSGDVRIHRPAGTDRQGDEYPEMLILMNIKDGTGRVWVGGEAEELRNQCSQTLASKGHRRQMWCCC